MKKLFTFTSETWLLIFITLFAVMIRFWQLNTLPAALNRDEAALGYNAWLLQTTGKDEWGMHWPVALKSFGDYKLPGYPLATIISFTIFGRSDWSVRFPAALAGSLLPLAIWWLTKQLGWNRSSRILVAALVAGLPFAIFYSRMAFEANVALTLVVISLGWLLFALQAPHPTQFNKGLLIATIGWFLAIFTYNTPLLLTPFVIVGLLLWLGKYNWQRAIIACLALGLVMGLGFSQLWQLSQHKAGITIFSDPTIESQIVDRYLSLTGWQQKIFGSRWWVYGTKISQNFIASWSPQFLVTHGGSHPWHNVPGTAHLTWFVYVFGIIGTIHQSFFAFKTLFTRQKVINQATQNFLWFLMIAALAPAVVTVDAPHATRSLLFMLLLTLMSIPGAQFFLQAIRQYHVSLSKIVTFCLLIWASQGTYHYLNTYFNRYPQTQDMFQPGLATILPPLSNTTKPIIVAGDGYTYISLAWYQPIQPTDFLATIERHPIDTIGFAAGKKVGNYTIRPDFKTPDADQSILLEWRDHAWRIREQL